MRGAEPPENIGNLPILSKSEKKISKKGYNIGVGCESYCLRGIARLWFERKLPKPGIRVKYASAGSVIKGAKTDFARSQGRLGLL